MTKSKKAKSQFWQKIKKRHCDKKAVLAENRNGIIGINLTQVFLTPEDLSFMFTQPFTLNCSRKEEGKYTMMHFETFLSGDDLLAH
jgi:hypothetical protein